MIPDIGVMIAAYVITRLVAMIGRKDVNIPAQLLAILAIVVTAIACFDLIISGSRRAGLPGLY